MGQEITKGEQKKIKGQKKQREPTGKLGKQKKKGKMRETMTCLGTKKAKMTKEWAG